MTRRKLDLRGPDDLPDGDDLRRGVDIDAVAEEAWTICQRYTTREEILEDLARLLRRALT